MSNDRFKLAVLAVAGALLLMVGSLFPALAAPSGHFDFEVVKGKRLTVTGRTREYFLYVPRQTDGLAAPPYPLVVLVHGFLRTAHHMSGNAKYLAARGMVVFVPQMDQWLWGYKKRSRNMDDVVDHLRWLMPRAADSKDDLFGTFDRERVGMLGHSSGGPIAIETIISLQKAGIAVDSLMLQDGIVWPRTMSRLGELKPVDLVSVRSEPAICNQHASALTLLSRIPFPYRDLIVVDSKHCDPENPTNFGCMCICGPSSDKYREIFVRLLYVYFKDRLKAPAVIDSKPTFEETVQHLEKTGKISLGKGW